MTARQDQNPPVRVSIVEDDEYIRGHLAHLVSRTKGFELVGQHATGEEALNTIPNNPPAVVLMDINLSGMSGIQCVHALKTNLPQLQILMLTIYEDSDLIFDSLKAGASGYLLKRTPNAQLLEAIRDVHAGGSPMTSHIARKVVQFFNQRQSSAPELQTLSDREGEVLQLLACGRLYKEIAEALRISMDTVRKHLQSIYQKLHVHSRTEAVVKYLQR